MKVMKIFVKFAFLVYFVTTVRAELKLVNVVFRHGDRVPENKGYEKYPNDPYAEESFFPIGSGGLTNTGKMREYHLGQYLRRQYDHFLGSTYCKGVVSARNTCIERAKMSLLIVLAALYPPKGDQIWNPKVNWQPIPTTFLSCLDDVLMLPYCCPKYLDALEQVIESPEYQQKLDEFVPLMKNLTIETGKLINSSVDMCHLYHGLVAMEGLNLELPVWTDEIFPDGQLYYGALLNYELFDYNDQLKRLSGGMFLRKFVDDMTAACENRLEQPRKIFLYSGHEFNVAGVLQSLNAYKPHIPRYSSAVIVELHRRKHEYFVEIKYYKGFVSPTDENESIDEVITVPGCSAICPLDEFIKLLKDHIATDDDIKNCDKRSIPEFIKTHKNLPREMIDVTLDDIKKEKDNRYQLQ